MRFLKKDRTPMSLVVFSATDKQLSKLDVSLGPCVIAAGQRRPIQSPLMQDGGETPDQASALFAVLTGRKPDDALRLVSESGHGRLFVCSADFLDAMANASQAMQGIPNLDNFTAEYDRLDSAWMKAVKWPAGYVSVKNRLSRMAHARVAREKGIPLYFWFGPAVPMRTVVAGTGPCSPLS
jgi:hypothetical protein